jgi:hypothetical protein
MAKTTKIAKSSWQLGWIDGLERKIGRNLVAGIEAEAYTRGVERAAEFRRRISAQKPERSIETLRREPT